MPSIDLTPEKIAAISAAGLGAIILLIFLLKLMPKRIRKKRFVKKWRGIQSDLPDEARWPDVLKEADKLLGLALKKRRFKGKTTGERMVSAREVFTDNDGVWFAHKLSKKYSANPKMKLTQNQMKKALLGFLQALKDLGALK